MSEHKDNTVIDEVYCREVIKPAVNLVILSFNKSLGVWNMRERQEDLYSLNESLELIQNNFLDTLNPTLLPLSS